MLRCHTDSKLVCILYINIIFNFNKRKCLHSTCHLSFGRNIVCFLPTLISLLLMTFDTAILCRRTKPLDIFDLNIDSNETLCTRFQENIK